MYALSSAYKRLSLMVSAEVDRCGVDTSGLDAGNKPLVFFSNDV